MNTLFQSIFTAGSDSITVGNFLACLIVSLMIGFFLAIISTYKNRYSRSFILTISLLPAIVCVVIMMVNGNIGAGVAVGGAFSLVRFRSAQGSAKEICTIFLTMGAGLIAGMGYLGFAVLFALIMGGMLVLYTSLDAATKRDITNEKKLVILLPENLDYNEIFDDVMAKYSVKSELVSVKTTNMGSLFKLTYNVVLKSQSLEKEFIDKLRCKNGNLEISISRKEIENEDF